MHSPVYWFGGKGNMTAKLPLHRTYVEAFGGGASLLFAKPPMHTEIVWLKRHERQMQLGLNLMEAIGG